ncbi:hypothetical protein [Pseudooceanicola onchidii]|uniref:hypothetical protein n=1 Tax=Pseudooceanicola onchidii TaxID=2562279 RepID=UPI0010AA275B|nr:hypothetical protein [Pseudooceanicola onchidii]
MRHILVIIALIVTAWAFLPGAAQAHDMPHVEMGDAKTNGDCADCLDMDDTGGHASGIDCHHGAGCGPAIHALPVSLSVIADPEMSRSTRPHDTVGLRSVSLSRDLPPPRS